MSLRPLTPIEARVLATLMEKARTVPDTYPLSLNGVVTGCNQKTSREPVMNVGEGQAQEALDDLHALSLVNESHGSRVAKYEHNFQRVYGVPEQSAVLLGLLMLRGPQTPGELRLNSERWYKFADIASVEDALAQLKARGDDSGALMVVQLARAPGMREQRWAHLLCGESLLMPYTQAGTGDEAVNRETEPVSLGQAERMQQRIESLERQVAHLYKELGLSQA